MQPIITHNSSSDSFWAKEVPFWVKMIAIYYLESDAQKNRKHFICSWEVPAKTKLLINLYWYEIHQQL